MRQRGFAIGQDGRRGARTPLPRCALTLIELMVAMTASAVVFVAALQAFQQGRFVGAHIDQQMTAAARDYDLWRLVAGDVGNSLVLQTADETGTWAGGPDSMQFLAVWPEGRPVQVEYKFEKAKGSTTTGQIVRSTRYCSGSVAIGQWERTVVAQDVAGFELRYAASTEGTNALTWTTDFRGNDAPPRAVEVHVTRAGAGGSTGGEPEAYRWVIPTRVQLPAGLAGGAS